MKHIITTIFFFIYISVYSQTGPGGVGSNDGSSNLKIWLKADDIDADGDTQNNPANGTAISTWADCSGNSNNFTQTGANRPTYNSSGTFNAVKFDPSSSTTQYMNGTITGSYSDGSVFFVTKPVDAGYSSSLFDNSDFSLRVEQWKNKNKVGYTRYGIRDYKTNINSPFNTNSIISFHKSGSSSYMNFRVNNSTQNLNIQSSAAGIPYDRIGKSSTTADKASGDFYEIILYNSKLNYAQIIVVENYLSAKYGSIPVPYDIYDEDDNANGDFDYDVSGIGRVDASNIHNDAQGTGIVRILNPSDLDDDEFLFWGHNNGTQQATETSDVPLPVQARFERVWRVSETNLSGTPVDVGNIDIRFDLTGLGSVTESDLRLLIDTDNDGTFADETPIAGATNIGGNVYQFSSVSGIANNLRFTLGTINSSQTPLPISLTYFNAENINDKYVELNWQTSSEINNDYFVIERSTNAKNWEEIDKISGAGNSSNTINYSYSDLNPNLNLSYYRLKQIDFDGNYTYSKIESVRLNNKINKEINIYPNPAKNIIYFSDNVEFDSFSVYTDCGKKIANYPFNLSLNIDNYQKGVYFVVFYKKKEVVARNFFVKN